MGISINPDILIWARESAGFLVEEAAKKMRFRDTPRSSAKEKLELYETGEKCPSRTQLNKFSDVYKRPLLTFYLSEPPMISDRGQDFRQTADRRDVRANGILDALLRNVRARQETVRDLLIDEDGYTRPDYVGSLTIDTDVGTAADRLSKVLNFDRKALSLRRPKKELFKRLRSAVENTGTFVLVLGDIGSYDTAISPKVFRGFAIADPIAPFVVINSKDARPAQIFTLIHEVVHIWLGKTGVSGPVSVEDAPENSKAKIERFCNDVASEFLLPQIELDEEIDDQDHTDIDSILSAIKDIAKQWSVSEPMVAYRMERAGRVSKNIYRQLWGVYQARLKKKQPPNGGPSYNIRKKFSLGDALMECVHRNVRGNTLTRTKAAIVLGAKPTSVESLLKHFEHGYKSYVSPEKITK